jgi:hypothetical protein
MEQRAFSRPVWEARVPEEGVSRLQIGAPARVRKAKPTTSRRSGSRRCPLVVTLVDEEVGAWRKPNNTTECGQFGYFLLHFFYSLSHFGLSLREEFCSL